MAFLERFRKNKKDIPAISSREEKIKLEKVTSGLTIEEFLPVDQDEKELVTLIASSILAGDRPNSEYRVKTILRRNDEKAVVTAIASAIMAGDNPESTFQVRKIKRIK